MIFLDKFFDNLHIEIQQRAPSSDYYSTPRPDCYKKCLKKCNSTGESTVFDYDCH